MTQLLYTRAQSAETAPDLIIDGRLALKEHGLMLSLAFTGNRRVWLVQGLWALLQRFQVIDYPEFADEGEDVRDMLPVLREWHAIWTGSTLLERFFWVGDMLFESRLPPGFSQDSARRLQSFAALLEKFAVGDGPISALTICSRDAAALAALNMIDAPIILTDVGKDGMPRLCRFLDDAGITCSRLGAASARRMSRAALYTPPPAVELALNCGVRLAGVQLFAPRAIAASLEETAAFEPDDTVYSEDHDPWRDASAVWCEVQP